MWGVNRRARTERAKQSIDRARAEVEALRSALVATEARAAAAEAKVSDAQARIAALTLMIEKLRRALYGRRSERPDAYGLSAEGRTSRGAYVVRG